eukprot:g1547.t1
MFDLWNKYDDTPANATYGEPAKDYLNSMGCTSTTQNASGTCVYEDDLFEERVHSIVAKHDPTTPLFVFWATHTVHGPLQPPDAAYDNFSFINVDNRRKYHSMVNYIDGTIGRVVQSFKNKGMFDELLIVMTTARGGKFSNWEGGIRVAAFASGGFLPASVRGTKQEGLMAGWDWYATMASLAGVDPTDTTAASAGLPPIDSFDMWPMLSGQNSTSPRRRFEAGDNVGGDDKGAGGTRHDTLVGAIIIPPYKILLGDGNNETLDNACWPGPVHPNTSAADAGCMAMKQTCGRTPETGCLYDVYADEGEHNNLAAAKPDVYNSMLAELHEVQQGVYSPMRGARSKAACEKGLGDYGSFWGPFVAGRQRIVQAGLWVREMKPPAASGLRHAACQLPRPTPY